MIYTDSLISAKKVKSTR